MPRVDTAKEVNVNQLSRELVATLGISAPPMAGVHGGYVEVLDESVTEAQLLAAVEAHEARPEPPPPPREPTRREVLAEKESLTPAEVQEALRLLLRGSSPEAGEGVRARGGNGMTYLDWGGV